jgi:hypothetical protein
MGLMHTLYYLYFDFDNKHGLIVKPIELYFLPNNQYMEPYILTYITFQF